MKYQIVYKCRSCENEFSACDFEVNSDNNPKIIIERLIKNEPINNNYTGKYFGLTCYHECKVIEKDNESGTVLGVADLLRITPKVKGSGVKFAF